MGSHLLIQADSRRIPIADNSVHCVVTSPPYFGLRDYSCVGQIGLESTPDLFVAAMVRVFREVRRVLRHDGVAFINLGDSYNSSAQHNNERGPSTIHGGGKCYREDTEGQKCPGHRALVPGLKPKDLMMIPHRVAIALQADGWYVRSDMVWSKPNPMPESVTDRPTKSHEYVFVLTKSDRYLWDADAVREPSRPSTLERDKYLRDRAALNGTGRTNRWGGDTRAGDMQGDPAGRNMRSVLTIPTESYPGSHFATYPRRLIEPLIRAATSERGCCPECGAPWAREVERSTPSAESYVNRNAPGDKTIRNGMRIDGVMKGCGQKAWDNYIPPNTIGWRPTCPHDREPVPCTVFDPFIGSGTTVVVANALGRRGIGLDLSHDYLTMAARRIERPHAQVARPSRDESFPLFATSGSAS